MEDVGCWDKANRAAKKAGYKGTQSVTKEGFTCQKWTEQSPQSHSYTVATYGDKGVGDHNYCRNPAEKYDETWCYTTNPSKRWDWCLVPTCPGKGSFMYIKTPIYRARFTANYGKEAKPRFTANTDLPQMFPFPKTRGKSGFYRILTS